MNIKFVSLSRFEFYIRLTFLRHEKSPLVLHAGKKSTLETSGAIQCCALSSDKSAVLHF